jgi:hypothetical protein
VRKEVIMSNDEKIEKAMEVNPYTGEIKIKREETLYKTFEISTKKFKREYLELPEELLETISSKMDKEPLHFYDEDGREYIFDLFPGKRLLGGMGEWWRCSGITSEDTIVIKVLDIVQKKFYISRKSMAATNKEVATGLFIGKRYNMVAGRKYELSDNYYFPIPDLATHVFICGITGSGKTVLGKAFVEEAVLQGIPSIVIDIKGDLSSLAIVPTSEGDFTPWVETQKRAKISLQDHFVSLEKFGISSNTVRDYSNKALFRIFTPRSTKGVQIGFGSPLGAPPYPIELYKTNKEEFDKLVASLTNAFIDRLYPGTKRSKVENERNFLYEIVHYAWLHNINLEEVSGMRELLHLIQEPPFAEIGGLPVEQYIDAENRRKRLLNKVNTTLSGPERMWFDGNPLSMELFLNASEGKTPVNIVNVAELDHFEDRSFVVAQIAYMINKWMRTQSGTDHPRLVFFIDEIGGGGGKQALFPSFPYECAAKWGLNYLVRQGRSFGVCCIFATQNPGDVDYKGLSNCHSWIIGKLATDRDRKKVMEGMELWGANAERVKINIANAKTGDFIIKDPRNEISFIKERWLMSYHRVLTMQEISSINTRPYKKN